MAAIGVGVTASAIVTKVAASTALAGIGVTLSASVVAVKNAGAANFSGAGTLSATSIGPVLSRTIAPAFTVTLSASVVAVTFTNMGMRKNGNYTLATFASNIEIPNWLAATGDSGFESSVVSGASASRLGPAVGSATKTITVTTRMDNSFAGNVTFQIMRNSTVVGTATVTTATTVQTFTFPGIAIAPGDVFWINATNSNSARIIYAVDTLMYFN